MSLLLICSLPPRFHVCCGPDWLTIGGSLTAPVIRGEMFRCSSLFSCRLISNCALTKMHGGYLFFCVERDSQRSDDDDDDGGEGDGTVWLL